MSTTERDAICADAHARLQELVRVRAVLWPDRDDPAVLSELAVVQSAIRELGRTGDTR
jgi:hypothetical protein